MIELTTFDAAANLRARPRGYSTTSDRGPDRGKCPFRVIHSRHRRFGHRDHANAAQDQRARRREVVQKGSEVGHRAMSEKCQQRKSHIHELPKEKPIRARRFHARRVLATIELANLCLLECEAAGHRRYSVADVPGQPVVAPPLAAERPVTLDITVVSVRNTRPPEPCDRIPLPPLISDEL